MLYALQFSTGEHGQTGFTEWSENKIGRIIAQIINNNNNQQLPFSVSASPQELTLRRGQSIEVKLDISTIKGFSFYPSALPPSNANIDMVSYGTFTPTGELGNSTGSFSEQSLSLEPMQTKQVSFVFTPALDLGSGEYTLMLGAQNDAVTIMKAVKVLIVG